jgi:hypothetical protein
MWRSNEPSQSQRDEAQRGRHERMENRVTELEAEIAKWLRRRTRSVGRGGAHERR